MYIEGVLGTPRTAILANTHTPPQNPHLCHLPLNISYRCQGQHLCNYMHYTSHYPGKMLNHCTIIPYVCFIFLSLVWNIVDLLHSEHMAAFEYQSALIYYGCSGLTKHDFVPQHWFSLLKADLMKLLLPCTPRAQWFSTSSTCSLYIMLHCLHLGCSSFTSVLMNQSGCYWLFFTIER